MAQDPPANPSNASKNGKQNANWRRTTVNEDIVEFAEMPTSELQPKSVPMTLATLESSADEAIGGLRAIAEQLADTMITQIRLTKSESPDEKYAAEIQSRINVLTEFRGGLITRCNILLAAIEERGGDVAAAIHRSGSPDRATNYFERVPLASLLSWTNPSAVAPEATPE